MKNLSLAQRRLLESLLLLKSSWAAIGRKLGVHPSTVKRELERNSKDGLYQAETAHRLSQDRKQTTGKRNQQKRSYYYYDDQTLIRKGIRFRASLRRAKKREIPLPKRAKGRRFRYTSLFKSYRPDQRKRRGWRRIFRGWRYEEWKKWWDRKKRMRHHYLENIFRTPRHWWIISVYVRNAYRKRRKPLYPVVHDFSLPEWPIENQVTEAETTDCLQPKAYPMVTHHYSAEAHPFPAASACPRYAQCRPNLACSLPKKLFLHIPSLIVLCSFPESQNYFILSSLFLSKNIDYLFKLIFNCLLTPINFSALHLL